MKNLRIYGTKPFNITVLHGGLGAGGEMAPVARELSSVRGVLEPLQIDWYLIEDCNVVPSISELGMVSYSTVDLRYLTESGHRRRVQFKMQTHDAGCLDNTLRYSYPSGISR